ncbi:MAG: hypothetical protein KDA20_07615 [Phycisphaerales bacterium]|nr:hypothetical protein [Phycisphaerales bacterium]
MVRGLWNLVAALAIANVIGLVGFFGWLKASDRISGERVETVRAMFSKTIAEELRNKALEDAAKAAEERQLQETGRIGRIPLSAEDRVAIIREYEELTREHQQRMQRETQDLRDALAQDRAQLAQERADFLAMKDAFEKERALLAELEGAEQFGRTVKLYESVKPDAARSMMQALLDAGEKRQVVAYLNAMKPATATKIITAFQGDDPALAADLLEGIRTHGLSVVEGAAPE